MGVFDRASIGIGTKSVDLRVALMHGAILLLDLEKEALHFAERAPVKSRSEFFDYARDFWRPAAKQSGHKLRIPLRC